MFVPSSIEASLWTFGLFPPFGHRELRCYEHQCTSFCFILIFNSLGYTSRSGISGLYDNSMINLLRNCQIILHNSCLIFIPVNNAPVSSHSHQHLYFLFVSLPYFSLSVCFDLHSLTTSNGMHLSVLVSYWCTFLGGVMWSNLLKFF